MDKVLEKRLFNVIKFAAARDHPYHRLTSFLGKDSTPVREEFKKSMPGTAGSLARRRINKKGDGVSMRPIRCLLKILMVVYYFRK